MASIVQVIKFEGEQGTFIWKHPIEDFNWGSQLIVHESQEAVFFLNGQALDSFGPGRHTLTTQNLPLVSGLFNLATGGETPFHCEVYFINKAEHLAIKWGTDTKVEYIEPTYGFPIQLGACGEMNVRLDDGRKLLIKVVGTENAFSQAQLVQKFRSFLMIHFKPYLVTLLKTNQISVFEIDEHLQEMSVAMQAALQSDFLDYGLSLERFFITSVIKPEDDENYRRFKDIHFRQYAEVAEAKLRQQVGVIDQQTAAQRMVIEAQGLAQKRSLEGYTYQDERGFDVAERVAGNQAVGQFSNMGIGMGMISGIGGTVGNKVGGMLQQTLGPQQPMDAVPPTAPPPPVPPAAPAAPAPAPATPASPTGTKCTRCGTILPEGAKFCLECGEKVVAVPAGSVVCPKCGATVPSGKFCLECGEKLI